MSSLDRDLVEVLAYRPDEKGTRIGFVDLEIPAVGLRIRGCILHQTHGATWVQIPSRVLQDENGLPVAGFTSDEARRRFADAVVRQIATALVTEGVTQ